ncbi:MAG: 1-(5-phosphoribosyl)-5-[(5-phosphoribosylamino)methylideneamino]imidazole-4-carboxamide isomerase [Dehalococcoidales bacterium]|nr:1-(5-phosphoribosyl)-5-[(5-phosphoribosylamino)methylideneamino]imidazole-4-carboxamide isomerase [Dehalococcoidales bacterium]
MEIIPAIDIRDGKCVRLYQGDYSMETVFSNDPVGIALNWQSMGAMRLHIVDLDGAATGELKNLDIIAEIANSILIPVQVGGGIRDIETIGRLFKNGVDRVILGTSAVEDPEMVQEACHRFTKSVIVGIDARDGKVSTRGWKLETNREPVEFARSMMKLGVKSFVFTDIRRDGTLTEPNFSALFELIDSTRSRVIASGGVSTLTHLKLLKKIGASGVIIGKALYTKDINLKQALDLINVN